MPDNLTLLSIHHADNTETLGIKTATGIIDVKRAADKFGITVPLTMEALLRDGTDLALHHLIKLVANAPDASAVLREEASIQYGRLFTQPGKIICIGLNFKRHAQESGMAIPSAPPVFSKFNNALAAHDCTITLPPQDVAYKFDYETELVIVIGKSARNVSEDNALDYVAGYCTGNDFSARDLQLERPAGQWLIGKTLDKFAPIGPYFVSANLVGDPNNLAMETRVNGELRQSGNTNDFIFNPQQIIAYLSWHWTLEPGDLIFTGTPHGVILGYPKEQQVWLKSGDEIISSIEKLGSLKVRLE